MAACAFGLPSSATVPVARSRKSVVPQALWGPLWGRHSSSAPPPRSFKPAGVVAPPPEFSTEHASPPALSPQPQDSNPTLRLGAAAQQVSDFATQLVTSLSQWPGQLPGLYSAQPEPQGMLPVSETAMVDITPVLKPVNIWELKQMRKLCHLTGLTYKMHSIDLRSMRRRHGLDLVCTSLACDIRMYEPMRTAEEVADEGDGMALSMADVKAVYRSNRTASSPHLNPDPTANMAAAAAALLNPLPPSSSQPGYDSLLISTADTQAQPASRRAAEFPMSQQACESVQSATESEPPQWQPRTSISIDSTASQLVAVSDKSISKPRWQSPAEMVAGMVSEVTAAAAAAAVNPIASAASSAVSSASSAVSSLYAAVASLPIASALGAGPLSTAPAAAAAVMAAAAAVVKRDKRLHGNFSTAANAVGLAAAAGPAAIAAAPGSSLRLAAPTQSTTGSPACPSEWFVCDEAGTSTRYFVIQGSDTVDHWKLNLTFDPVHFEDPELGIKVHRGAYEAAQILYECFLPMVCEHLDSSPFAKICFTGHSIGGSLGVLLALMYIKRGVLPASSLSTIYTFGAPAVLCMENLPASEHHSVAAPHQAHSHTDRQNPQHHKGSHAAQQKGTSSAGHAEQHKRSSTAGGHGHVAKNDSMWSQSTLNQRQGTSSNGARGGALLSMSPRSSAGMAPLPCVCDVVYSGSGHPTNPLQAMGLPEHAVRNIIMARDIVPRAFACDYSLVADIIKGWGPNFKNHGGLAHPGRKHLYSFTGRMLVLQPDSWHSFVGSDPEHPLLPPGPEMYLLSKPVQAGGHGSKDLAGSADSQAAATSDAAGSADQQSSSTAAAPRRLVYNVKDALYELMDNPHPLDTLADPGAYLEKGSISRYHNPDHYTAALGRLIFIKRAAEGHTPVMQHAAAVHRIRIAFRSEEAAKRLEQANNEASSQSKWRDADAAWDSSDVDTQILAPLQGKELTDVLEHMW